MSTARSVGIALLLLLGSPAPSWAEDAPSVAPPPPASDRTSSVQDLVTYGEADATCRQWGNGCQTCRRQDGGSAACSTPGIACVPGPVICRGR